MANCTINEKLQYILETKDLIKAALETQDIEVLESDTFRKYAEYITEIRKVSSVNGKVGDVTITAEELGALTEIPSEYVTETELNDKGYLTSIPDTYITEDELTTALSDKVSQTALNEAIEGVDVGVKTINNTKGDINIKTINGESILGEGDIQIKSDSEETDPIFDKWKNADNVIAGNGAIYDTDGASEEEIHPSVVIGKDAMVWSDGIAIGENAYAEMGAVTIGKNITSYGLVSIGSDNNGSGIAIGKNNRGNGISIGSDNNSSMGIAIGKNITENYGGIVIGDNISNPTDNGIAIGRNAKVNEQYPNDTDNGEGIAIGMNAVAYNKDDVVIGSGVMTDFLFKTNINNVIKGDSNKYAYIKDNNGIYTKILDLINNGGGSSEGGSIKVVEMTQAEYDALQIKEEGVIYVITDAAEIAIPTKLSELENDKGYITEIPSEYVTDTELSPLVLNVTQSVNSVEIEKYNKAKNTIYYKTINGESILGEGDIQIQGGGGSGSINIKELTQAEYNALTSYDDDTFYVITDADKQYVIKSDLDNYYTKEEGDEHYDYDKRYWNSFQYTNDADNWISLRNGTSLIGGSIIYFKTINGEKTVGSGDISFKTINGESLIGSGNIQIQGGSADLSNYYTKSEIDSLIGNVSSKITEINNLI